MTDYNLELHTYLAPSNVCDGVGVFAIHDIPENFTIWKFTEEQCKKYKWEQIPPSIEDYVVNMTFCDEEGFWLDCDLDRMYTAYYVNHSERANVRLGDIDEYITTRIIFKDEEILFNYPKKHQIWL
tara:strand:- start:439 stop:816 length:378 start_codon:yes stop_codon:yes gene_type:complete